MNVRQVVLFRALSLIVAVASLVRPAWTQDDARMESFREGQSLIQSEEYAKAAEVFQKCVDADDEFAEGWFMLGYALHMDGKYEQALKAHRRASAFESSVKPIATYNVACALALTGAAQESLQSLREAIELGFDDEEKIRSDSDLFSLHMTTGFSTVLAELNGDDERAELLEEAQQHIDEGQFDQAVEDYRSIVTEDPNDDFACYRLGYSLHGAGKLDEAIEFHEKATKFPATKGIANYNWGCALSLKGEKEAAIEKFQAAVKNGFVRLDAYENDPDLENVRDEQSFKDLVAGIKKKMAQPPAAEVDEPDKNPAPTSQPNDRLTWDNLDQRLNHAADSGYAGTVLVVRNGEIVLHQGYGMANQEKQIANTPETIFAIGSTPIDFTKVSILLLAEQDKLQLSDPISKFLSDVPDDKKSMTIEHLMTGRSGLQDFHDLPSEKNADHDWIDRDEAVRRILAQKLLFAPGEKRQHSHSAFGLLAAIIDLVSQQSYQDFTRENLFKPAGMEDTGFFGEPIAEERMAVGYGRKADAAINAPPYWGKTSWLVMGSGGQVSTTGDMHRWLQALHQGKILSPESLQVYFGDGINGILAGGDEFGFEIMYTQDPDNLMIITANNVDSRPRRLAFNQLGQSLARLVSPDSLPRYALGIRMRIEQGEGVYVEEVIPESAAERDGLQAGDRLVKVGDVELMDDPLTALRPYLNTGDKIPFEVEREGETLKIDVKPILR